MANIPMKSIKLPGLSDTYTFLQESDVASIANDVTKTIIDYDTIDSVQPENGNISSGSTTNGQWNNVNANYQHVLWPIAPGDVVSILNTTSDGTLNYAVMSNPTTPENGQLAGLSAADGFNTVFQRTANTAPHIFIAPSDSTHILIMTLYNNRARSYTLTVNGVNVAESLGTAVNDLGNRFETLNVKTILTADEFSTGVPEKVQWESGRFDYTNGAADSKHTATKRLRTAELYVANGAIKVVSDGVFDTLLALFQYNETDGLYHVYRTYDYSLTEKFIPAGVHYRIALANHTNRDTVLTDYPRAEIPEHVQVLNITGGSIYNPDVRWCALGDSITQGYVSYSYIDQETQEEKATANVNEGEAWAFKLAKAKNWTLVNKGVGGSGYVMRTQSDIDSSTYITPAWKVVQGIDFSQYNLVTLAYGVNDYKGNASYLPNGVPIGSMNDVIGDRPEKLIPAMRKTIETIITSNPKIKLIVLTPLNCHGYNGEFGDQTTNYAIGTARGDDPATQCGTLLDVRNAIITVCEYYGLEYIDMTTKSCVNRQNLETLLIDGVHPGAECHSLLAHELGAKINF